jgi:hypothetical protein
VEEVDAVAEGGVGEVEPGVATVEVAEAEHRHGVPADLTHPAERP